MASVKKNFVFNLVLTISTYLFSLIVFPYVSRILGVELIGRVSFADQVIRYFMLLATMGVATVGIREISACGNDRRRRSEVFAGVFSFNLLLTTIAVVLALTVAFVVPQLVAIRDLLVIGTGSILFSTLLVEWFYQGLENFRYVAIRTVGVKCLYVIAIFLFVKQKDDYLRYVLINMLCIAVNALINLSYSRKFIDFSFRSVSLRTYAKPILSLGVYMLMLSFFTTFNVVYLGFVQTEYETGLYATSIKIYTILLAVMSAFTTVMMPRMSSLLSLNDYDEFHRKLDCSWNLVFAFAIPIAIGGIVLAPHIISLLAGEAFMEASLPMRIIMTNLVICSSAQIWVMQLLLPMKEDRIVLHSSMVAAATGILLNVLLVGRYGALGSAITIVVAELAGDTFSLVYVLGKHLMTFPVSMCVKYLCGSIPYVVLCVACVWLHLSPLVTLLLAVASCLAYFVVLNRWIIRDSYLSSVLKRIGEF